MGGVLGKGKAAITKLTSLMAPGGFLKLCTSLMSAGLIVSRAEMADSYEHACTHSTQQVQVTRSHINLRAARRCMCKALKP